MVEKLPLPDIQPKCPEHWDTAAWNSRSVAGNSRYHLFVPGGTGPLQDLFILQVSNKSNGKRVYENISLMSSEELEKEMKKFVGETYDNLSEIMWEAGQEAELS